VGVLDAMARVLVTGGAGFIGANLVRGLLSAEYEVTVFDNFSTGRRDHLIEIEQEVVLIEGDVRESAAVAKAMMGVDFVLHYAAARAVNKSVEQPTEAHAVNATGTFNVLLAARDAEVKRVVFASTAAVYGNPSNAELFTENMLPQPVSPYAAAKLSGEAYCQVFSACYGLETAILRLFNVYGPWQYPEGEYSLVVPIFLDKLVQGDTPEIHGTGEQSRDFVFAADVVQANLLALRDPQQLTGDVFNIGSGSSTSIRQVFDTIQQQLGTSITPKQSPSRAGDVLRTCADIRKAKEQLGYQPTYDFDRGIAESITHYQSRRVS
jgi:UDP-glucose 4-epimerase